MSSLNIASRALTTNLAALQVIGHNIANVNTAGYSRQSIQLTQTAGQFLGNGYFGKGVEIAGVSRAYDAYLTREAQTAGAVAASDEIRYKRLQQLEALFPLGEQSLGVSLNNALNAWSAIASSPTDTTARTVAIGQAEALATRLRDTSANLDELRQSGTLQVSQTVSSINTLAQQIADLNRTIIELQGSNRVPNDLLDQRDQLVTQLNQYVQTSTVENTNGGLTVFVGGSQPLVLGSKAASLQVDKDALDPLRLKVSIVQAGSTAFELNTDFLAGGELKGLLTYVNKDLPDAVNALGRLTMAMAMQVNAQHRLGLDLNGNAGADFYSLSAIPAAVGVQADGVTPATVTVQAQVVDPTQFQASDYELRFTATGVDVVRRSDGVTQSFASLPATVDGLEFYAPGFPTPTPAVGDRYLIRPFADAARNIDVAISKPDSLAAASPILLTPDLQSGSGLTVESVYLTDGNPTLLPTFAIEFNSTTGAFDVTNLPPGVTVATAPGAYSPGQPMTFTLDLGGGNTVSYSMTLRGTPVNGDSYTLEQGTGTEMNQNFGNAQAMLALRDKDTFGGVSLADGYVSVFSGIANNVQSAKFAAEFSATTASNADAARAAVSGVNLDEEAARLLQFQQAYQASAKYLQVAQGIFDTLIQSFR